MYLFQIRTKYSLVSDDNIIRSHSEKRALGHVQYRTGSLHQILREMERNGPSGIREESIGTDVPLPTRSHKFLSETDVTTRLYIAIAK